MNPRLGLLKPYPFEKLRALLAGVTPPAGLAPVNLHIGEPQHPTPAFLKEALAANLGGLARYPLTRGLPELRGAIAAWLARRHGIPAPDAETQVLPVQGSREALFAIAQVLLDPAEHDALVVCPNPFYQIYEGAALLGGARPYFVNATRASGFAPDWSHVPEHVWKRTRLVFTCSPGNPTGRVMAMDEWERLFALSDRHGFTIVADECYGEIYFDEAAPPLGALTAAQALGRDDYRNLVVFHSLSKRSNVPGMRSGFVAGDAKLVGAFLRYRTYHGCAMNPAVQAASAAAWDDEGHVRENRRLYARKFAEVTPRIARLLPCAVPDAGFYLWADTSPTGLSDTEFALGLARQQNVVVLPGSFLARQTVRGNPGSGFVRMALVAQPDDCIEAAARIEAFCSTLKRES